MHRTRPIAIAAATITIAGAAHAQDGLVVGSALGPDSAVKVYRDGAWHDLFTPALGSVWAIAADQQTQTIYYLDGDELYAWDETGGERFVGLIFDPFTGTELVMVGMGIDRSGQMFVTRDIGGTFPQGFYEVDKTTGVAVLADAWPQFELSITGFDFDPIDGTLFAAQTDTSPNGRSWMVVTPNEPGPWTYTAVAPFPPGLFDVDGAAIYDGTAYLVTDDTGPFYMLDLDTPGATPQTLPSPWTGSGLFAGATFAAWLIPDDCVADTNGNGVLDPGDFTAWVTAYNAQDPVADQNGDGIIDPADFTAWVVNYNAGC
ncbi:MAG: GC-type dockerin domain-anchored protein [Phycisphaerales bacterium]